MDVSAFLSADSLALLIAATLSAGTVVALAALGLLINERAGVLNLGAEGMMLVAAIAGFATGVTTGSDWLAFAAGAGWPKPKVWAGAASAGRLSRASRLAVITDFMVIPRFVQIPCHDRKLALACT